MCPGTLNTQLDAYQETVALLPNRKQEKHGYRWAREHKSEEGAIRVWVSQMLHLPIKDYNWGNWGAGTVRHPPAPPQSKTTSKMVWGFQEAERKLKLHQKESCWVEGLPIGHPNCFSPSSHRFLPLSWRPLLKSSRYWLTKVSSPELARKKRERSK